MIDVCKGGQEAYEADTPRQPKDEKKRHDGADDVLQNSHPKHHPHEGVNRFATPIDSRNHPAFRMFFKEHILRLRV